MSLMLIGIFVGWTDDGGQGQLPLTIALFGWENLGLFLPASSFIALEGGGRFVVVVEEEDRDELFAYVLAASLWTR